MQRPILTKIISYSLVIKSNTPLFCPKMVSTCLGVLSYNRKKTPYVVLKYFLIDILLAMFD